MSIMAAHQYAQETRKYLPAAACQDSAARCEPWPAVLQVASLCNGHSQLLLHWTLSHYFSLINNHSKNLSHVENQPNNQPTKSITAFNFEHFKSHQILEKTFWNLKLSNFIRPPATIIVQ